MPYSTQIQEKLHQALIEATIKLEEQKYEQQVQESKVYIVLNNINTNNSIDDKST